MGVLAEPARQGLGDGVGSQGVGEWGSQGMEAVSSLEKMHCDRWHPAITCEF
jgi:hypothetical protein